MIAIQKSRFAIENPRAAAEFLGRVSHNVRGKGEEYYEKHAVFDLQELTPRTHYLAKVHGTDDYEVELYFQEGKWESECTCPVGFQCKHAVASMMALLTGVSPGVAAGRATPTTSGETKPKAQGTIEAELKRTLNTEERQFVRQVRELFRRSRLGAITQWDLQSLFPGQPTDRWKANHGWPSDPNSELEFWNYISFFAREAGLRPPEFMDKATDEKNTRTRIHEWRREQEVESWRRRLQWVTSDHRKTSSNQRTDFRARMNGREVMLEWKPEGGKTFEPVKPTRLRQLADSHVAGTLQIVDEAHSLWLSFYQLWKSHYSTRYHLNRPEVARLLHGLLVNPAMHDRVVNSAGVPLARPTETVRWQLKPPAATDGDYSVRLTMADGSPITSVLVALDGRPSLFVTTTSVFQGPPLLPRDQGDPCGVDIPAPAIESREGIEFLLHLGVELPAKLRERVSTIEMKVRIRCELMLPYDDNGAEWMHCAVLAEADTTMPVEWYAVSGWRPKLEGPPLKPPKAGDGITLCDRTLMNRTPEFLAPLGLNWSDIDQCWRIRVTKTFPDKFAAWLAQVPPEVKVELEGDLATLRHVPVQASVRLDCESSGVDWFDLKVVLDVADTELTPAELKTLLDARGKFVRLGKKGWQRLQFNLTPEDDERMARLGLSAGDFSAEPQRFHALQLADDAAAALLPAAQAEAIKRRASEIQTRVAPPVPAAVRAQLRPYQIEGFHFLAYLSANHFGGVLADDMGLGKTVQALAWLAWLREQDGAERKPSLVVCPKSVMDNWRAEAVKFVPDLTVQSWRGGSASALDKTMAGADLFIVNYTQLRSLGDALRAVAWRVVILDEGQFIKNPTSQTARAACSLKSDHRLILTGTPIENRLLDLWSLMSFAMPGVLGNRAQFGRRYDHAEDPLARRRLSARVRPFLLRRTKGQVAAELPDRIEEDLLCEMEGDQETLYRAEFKHAQQMLLAIRTKQEFDRQRFNFLTSLLRLRQICCHPALVNDKLAHVSSAKLDALLELIEPLMEEGHKVLVFSQFVTLLDLVRLQVQQRQWPHFHLTGQTENRGELVERFQKAPGAAVFLVSLKAGGFGLNLTAASYVVLFDPWWNPAVENQAIDRTHRIGQTRHVNAYRLLIKNSIEEKIRVLQRAKSALAQDILGEEAFARSLTLDDLKFLFTDD